MKYDLCQNFHGCFHGTSKEKEKEKEKRQNQPQNSYGTRKRPLKSQSHLEPKQ